MAHYSRGNLVHLKKRHDTLVGIDSDGCVFDTMEVKQKNHFHPLILQVWGLEAIEPQVRAAAEFVNLHSAWRGSNRFVAMLKTFDLLQAWPEAAKPGVSLPRCDSLRAYVESGLPLGNPSLKEEVRRTGDAELKRLLEWSLAVNRDIEDSMEAIPPFDGVRECLEKMGTQSDLIVVSQTPEDALVKEWDLHGIRRHVQVIAGQELGSKAEQLRMAAQDRYAGDRILMIGDAPGDLKAANALGACFFPILPGEEEVSWRALRDEGYDRFLGGSFTGTYQDALVGAFQTRLPEIPPWSEASAAPPRGRTPA